MKKNKYFTNTDAWLLASLTIALTENKEIDLSKLLQAGDILNHSIFELGELKESFIKLQKRGIIKVNNCSCEFTKIGLLIIDKASRLRGGLFTIINNYNKIMNSYRIVFPDITEIDKCSFINKKNINKAYENYLVIRK